MVAWSGILIILVIPVILFLLIVPYRRAAMGKYRVSPRRPRNRHISIRIICGTAGVALLVAVGIGTWKEVQRCYADFSTDETLVLHVPTKPVPITHSEAGEENTDETEKGRFLFHVVFTDSGLIPLHAEEFELYWPQDRNRKYGNSFGLDELSIKYSFILNPNPPRVRNINATVLEQLCLERVFHFQWERHGISAVRMCTLESLDGGYLADFGGGVRQNRLFSIAPSLYPVVYGFYFIKQVAEDDPLRDTTLAEFVQMHFEKFHEPSGDGTQRRIPQRPSQEWDFMRGLALVFHLGFSSVVALLAAFLLTQVFARRSLAFVGILALVILYVAILDRTALNMHISRLTDPQATVSTRLAACEQAKYTFFHRKTALEQIRALAEDQEIPEQLRNAARDARNKIEALSASHMIPGHKFLVL
ncbi:MAG: hypothetical protein ABIH23_10985 [bacterium]